MIVVKEKYGEFYEYLGALGIERERPHKNITVKTYMAREKGDKMVSYEDREKDTFILYRVEEGELKDRMEFSKGWIERMESISEREYTLKESRVTGGILSASLYSIEYKDKILALALCGIEHALEDLDLFDGEKREVNGREEGLLGVLLEKIRFI